MSRFYIISLGPGHPELITIQALKALSESDIVYVPARSLNTGWKGSVAYRILKNIYDAHESWFKSSASFDFIKNWEDKFHPVTTPMSYDVEAWQDQVDSIADGYKTNSKVGFVTLGDAGIYSSAYYLLNIIKDQYPEIYDNTEVVPGISSISYGSSRVKTPLCLGNMNLEIVPMHTEDVKSTKVYMRLHKGDDVSHINGDNVYSFENLGFENEVIKKGTPGIIENYLTVLVDFAQQDPPKSKEK